MIESNKYNKILKLLPDINKLMAGVLYAITLVFFTACSSESIKNGRYYNKKHKFSIQFPENWEKQKPGPGIVVTFGDPENTEKVSIQKQKLPAGRSLKEITNYLKGYIANMGGRIVYESNEIIDSVDAIWFLIEFPNSGEMGLTYYFVKNDFIYSILCFADTQDFYEDKMRTIAQSFRFEE